MKDKVVFLDRDGTINVYKPYLDNPKDFKLIAGSAKAIKLLNENNFKVFIVSNQSGVGRGFFSTEVVISIHKRLKYLLLKESAYVDGIFFCPHLPEDNCNCRKPKTGLLTSATSEIEIDLENSYMVGDNISDIKAGLDFNCKTILVLTGLGKSTELALVPQYKEKIIIGDSLSKVVKDIIL